MKRVFFTLCAGAIGCALALQFPLAANAKEKVVYSFAGPPDGVSPVAGLIDVNGTLYGTTWLGGAHCKGGAGCGTVFALDPKTGAETVLYSFCSENKTKCLDGEAPTASLIDVNGTLYGTTAIGGTANCSGIQGVFVGCGTLFALDPNTGAETVVHSFGGSGGKDGSLPYDSLIDVNGKLYGTTEGGGANCQSSGGCGTVFALDPTTGAETVLYSFCAQKKCRDGSEPTAALVDTKGTLYGTTQGGGAYPCLGYGCGTVFALDLKTGAETVLHSFGSSDTDGTGPFAGLINVKGTLYGTTDQGGSNANKQYCYYGCGTVFSLDPATGVETVLYAFCSQGKNCKDGQTPNADVIDVKGTLYGTTLNGGAYGWGLLFALDPNTGAETVLHAFGSGTDGLAPNAATLIDVNGTLYGTTAGGGTSTNCYQGCGTVFALRP
jgi:uncharacterized repeat protein (TIGR03803 family)